MTTEEVTIQNGGLRLKTSAWGLTAGDWRPIPTHPLQSLQEVGLQIIPVFEADVQPHNAVSVVGTSGRGMKIVGHCQARHTSPAIADLKELQLVYKALHLRLREPGLKHDGEHARRACEVPLPELVARAGRKSRGQNAFNLGPLAEP